MKYFNDQNTEGYTSEQLEKMNQEIETLIEENGFDPDFHQQEIKTAQEKILAEMDSKIEEEQTDAEKLADTIFCTCIACGKQYTKKQYHNLYLDISYSENNMPACQGKSFGWICECGQELQHDYSPSLR